MKTGRYRIVVADGTHEFQRLMLYREELLDKVFDDFRIYFIMFHCVSSLAAKLDTIAAVGSWNRI